MTEQPLRIHFLNVGHGDCTLIEFPSGRLSMLDINTHKDLDEDTESEVIEASFNQNLSSSSGDVLRAKVLADLKSYEDKLVDPVDYLDANFAGQDIFRFVATHPDMDHLSGLARLVASGRTIQNIWDTDHDKSFVPEDFDSSPYDYEDWEAYQRLRDETTNSPKTLKFLRGANGSYFGDEHDRVSVWAPTPALVTHANDAEEYNHISYVLALQHGNCVIVLGGDGTEKTWQDIHDHFDGDLPKVSLLKASHHGRDSGYHHKSVSSMSPDHVVCSVGKLPETDASNKYRNQGSKVYTTRKHGTIIADCYLDGRVELWDAEGASITK